MNNLYIKVIDQDRKPVLTSNACEVLIKDGFEKAFSKNEISQQYFQTIVLTPDELEPDDLLFWSKRSGKTHLYSVSITINDKLTNIY